jgi:hypothetical protein
MCDRPKRYRRSRRVLPLVDGGHEPAYDEVIHLFPLKLPALTIPKSLIRRTPMAKEDFKTFWKPQAVNELLENDR